MELLTPAIFEMQKQPEFKFGIAQSETIIISLLCPFVKLHLSIGLYEQGFPGRSLTQALAKVYENPDISAEFLASLPIARS